MDRKFESLLTSMKFIKVQFFFGINIRSKVFCDGKIGFQVYIFVCDT